MELIFTTSTAPRHQPIAAVGRESSEDQKLTRDLKGHPVSATATSQASCDETCPFMGAGCYAEGGNMQYTTRRLNAWDVLQGERSPEVIAEAEAAAIRRLSGSNPLRLHTVGDCKTDQAAAIVADAAMAHTARYGQPAWTYTHAWRAVQRQSWGTVSVLASCETEEDIVRATAEGWACAIVVNKGEVPTTIAGMKTIHCPQQTGGKPDCARCLICAKDTRLKGKAVVVFEGHGATRKLAIALESRKGA